MSATKSMLRVAIVALLGCKTSDPATNRERRAALSDEQPSSRAGRMREGDPGTKAGSHHQGTDPMDAMEPSEPLAPSAVDEQSTADTPPAGGESLTGDQPEVALEDPVATDTPAIPPMVPGDDVVAGPEVPPATPPTPSKPFTEEDMFKAMPAGSDQLKVLCARPGQDKVRQVFCGSNPPTITSLIDLQRALGLGIVDPTQARRGDNGERGNAAFTFTAGSSSLVGKFTSAINPRLIMFTPPTGRRIPDVVVLGFVRGEQFVELIAGDPSTNQLNFFLVRFEQDCNERPAGCKVGELLTPGVERSWRHVTIYEDHDLQNTVADCKHCHQPGGEGTSKILRMQELRNPWTHFLRENNDGGMALIRDYEAAHGTEETYAGIPGPMVAASEPRLLENLIRDLGFGDQPNEFPSAAIEREVRRSSDGQPEDNTKPGRSATWDALYERFVRGEVIAPPYHDVKVTDPRKLATMTKAYQDFRAGALPLDRLPDIREVLPESELRDMGFMVKAGLTGAQILMNACAQCHNSSLIQTIGRARFNVDLSKMSRGEKELAIERLRLSAHDVRKMPPERIRTLTPAEIELLIEELRK